jgi:hypothetical protein
VVDLLALSFQNESREPRGNLRGSLEGKVIGDNRDDVGHHMPGVLADSRIDGGRLVSVALSAGAEERDRCRGREEKAGMHWDWVGVLMVGLRRHQYGGRFQGARALKGAKGAKGRNGDPQRT